MIDAAVALVLGAGASVAMGYPTGAQLRRELLLLNSYDNQSLRNSAGLDEKEVQNFSDEFRRSGMLSIDAFLARRPEFAEIGKKAIAALLLAKEQEDRLFETPDDDKWYQYLLNLLATDTWEELSFSKLKIVTFNYDRSLEHFLLESFRASYGKSKADVLEKLATLEIVHVYGSLGPTLPNDREYLPYALGVTRGRVEAAAAYLKVIPEGRNVDHTVQSSRRILLEADAVAFLGFGFDSINLERLDASVTCTPVVQRGNGKLVRRICATCLDMTSAEVVRVANLLATGHHAARPGVLPENFIDGNCLQMLRETLIIHA